jgi:hypothetical protein
VNCLLWLAGKLRHAAVHHPYNRIVIVSVHSSLGAA